MLCDVQISSGNVYHLEQPHAKSFFHFPIVFGINLISFIDGKDAVAIHSIKCLPFSMGPGRTVQLYIRL